MNLSSIVRPSVLLLGPVALSFTLWSIPGGESYALRGFAERSHVTIGAVLLLVAWYGSCLVAFGLGSRIGKSVPPHSKVVAMQGSDRFAWRFYLTLTILASVGVGFAVAVAASQVSIVQVVTSGEANALNAALGYELGVATLRYTAAISAPVGIYLTIRRGFAPSVAAYNSLLLVAVSAFSARLLLIMAVVVILALLAHDRFPVRVRITRVLAVAMVLYVLLSLLNYSRNAGFYQVNGVHNVFSMNNYQIASYLGTPAQVSLGLSNTLLSGELDATQSIYNPGRALVPSFLSPDVPQTIEYIAPPYYMPSVNLAPNVSTDSAFAGLVALYGLVGAALSLGILVIAGAIWGHASRYDGLSYVAAGVIAYGLAELWRVFLFTQGVLVYLLLAVLLATVIGSFGKMPSAGSRRVAHRSGRR